MTWDWLSFIVGVFAGEVLGVMCMCIVMTGRERRADELR
jgi:hypothetical protein